MPSPVWTRHVGSSALLVLVLTTGVTAQDVATRFPAPAQVAADFRDDAEQYAALSILQAELDRVSGKPMSHAAYERDVEYTHALTAIEGRHFGQGGLQSKENKAFGARWVPLTRDDIFRKKVTARYGTSALAAGAASRPAVHDRGTIVTSAGWVVLVTLVAMVLVTWSVVGRSFVRVQGVNLNDAPSGLPALPPPIATVTLPGMDYSEGLISGFVLGKESRAHYSERVVVRNEPYAVGLNVYQSSWITSRTVSVVHEDIYRLRTPSGTEAHWSFFGGALQASPGQVLSATTKALTRDSIELTVIYNHDTGQLVDQLRPGTHRARFRYGWLAGTVTGAIGIAIAALMLNRVIPNDYQGDPLREPLWRLSLVMMSVITAGFLTLLIGRACQVVTQRRRDAVFRRHYLPKLEQFFRNESARFRSYYQTSLR